SDNDPLVQPTKHLNDVFEFPIRITLDTGPCKWLVPVIILAQAGIIGQFTEINGLDLSVNPVPVCPYWVCACHHVFPSTRSTKQPLTCSPGCRQWVRMSALSQPASSRASARMGIRSKARSS